MKINSITFDIVDLKYPIDTSYEFCERLFKVISTKVVGGDNPTMGFSASMYFHRHLVPVPDEAVLEARRKSLSSFVSGSNRCLLQSNLGVDMIHCVSEEASVFSHDRTSSIILDDAELHSDTDIHPQSQDLEAVSAFYILHNAAGHYALHLRPYSQTASVDVFSLSAFDFVEICEVLKNSFGLDSNSNVKIFTSVR